MVLGCSSDTQEVVKNYENLGGKMSVEDVSKQAFSKGVVYEDRDLHEQFYQGRLFFKTAWVEAPASTKARDGLGPLFSSISCLACHVNNGGGGVLNKKGELDRSVVLRLSNPKIEQDAETLKKGGFMPDPHYGAQVSIRSNTNISAEAKTNVSFTYKRHTYKDGKSVELRIPHFSLSKLAYGALEDGSVISPRRALSMVGLGEIEKIPEQDILKNVDEKDSDKDGISGRANYVYDIVTDSSALGRFTWKGSAPSVLQQSAAAFSNDMGISSPLFPQENCSKTQEACRKANKSRDEFDITKKRLDAVAFYLRSLKVPQQRETLKHSEGAKLFTTLECVKCHKDSFTTCDGNTIHPFSDFLLHDMGEDLDDARAEFLASSSEWRTPPLWGLGLSKKLNSLVSFLHDGRARSIEEAILWHGGEAKSSREKFSALSVDERTKLLGFLNSI